MQQYGFDRTERGWQHVWAFRRLFQYVEYTAADHGVEAVQVPPNHTPNAVRRVAVRTKTTATENISNA